LFNIYSRFIAKEIGIAAQRIENLIIMYLKSALIVLKGQKRQHVISKK